MAIATVLLIVGAVAAAGTAAAAIGKGQQEAKTADFNARAAEQNAALALQAAQVREQQQRFADRRVLARIKAATGASGIQLVGSPLEVLEESAAQAELDALLIRHEGAIEARGFKIEAAIQRQRGKEAKRAGIIKAGTTLLTAAASLGQQIPGGTPSARPGLPQAAVRGGGGVGQPAGTPLL